MVKNGHKKKKCLKTQNSINEDQWAECRSTLLGCRMALGHAVEFRPWWADFSRFSNVCFMFSSFLENIFFVCDHETLSYSATNSLKHI